jgi:hypothetical protein
MRPLRRRMLGILLAGGVGTLVVGAAIPVVLGGRSLGLPRPASPSAASATPIVQIATEVPARASAAPTESAGPTGDPIQDVATSEPAILLDEHFDTNEAGWRLRTDGTVWFGGDTYHLNALFPNRFVAVRAPLLTATRNIVVTGVFHKVGGPDGGGYGLILRDRSATPLDGESQVGEFYVFEVSDVGEFGVWRRDESTWIELVPWAVSTAVHTGRATNQLTVRASGDRFQFEVNGMVVVQVTDRASSDGYVGLFVGGDGNQVAADRFVVRSAE